MSITAIHRASVVDQIIQILAGRIRSGEYPPETQLPPDSVLAAEFGVSRASIRSAMDVLAAQRLIFRRQGVGTFVSHLATIANPLNQPVPYQSMIEANGCKAGVEYLDARLTQATPGLAEALRLEPATYVAQIDKMFTADGDPVIYCTNTIPLWVLGQPLAKRLLADPSIDEPFYDFFDVQCNQQLAYFVAKIRPEVTQNCVFYDQTWTPNTPVLVMEEVGYNAQERPILHTYQEYPGNRMSFELVRRWWIGQA